MKTLPTDMFLAKLSKLLEQAPPEMLNKRIDFGWCSVKITKAPPKTMAAGGQ